MTENHEGAEPLAGPYDPDLKEAGQYTSPTWELELFLSGAFVFSSFQLPGIIEGAFRRLEPHVADAGQAVLFDGTLYAKAIAFTLILTFTVHLVSRAYWVAMLGLYSVFPGGIRWDEMKIGPVAREVYEARTAPLPTLIARLDNFCSIAFSTGLLLAVVFVYTTVIAGAIAGLAYLLATVFTHGEHVFAFLLAVAGLFVLLPIAGTLIDRRFGDRLPREARGHRALRALVVAAYSVNLMRFTGPMMWTLATNIGRKKATALLLIALMSIMFLSMTDRLANSDRLSFNSYDYFALSREHSVRAQYYESQREPDDTYSHTPSIQSDVIRDPYVKLFIPYVPSRDNDAVTRACPGVRKLQDRGIQLGSDTPVDDSVAVPALACLTRLHDVTLDGARLPQLQFSFYEHPRTGVKGLLAYIHADSLGQGRHTITVMPVLSASYRPDSTERSKDARKPAVIAFWR